MFETRTAAVFALCVMLSVAGLGVAYAIVAAAEYVASRLRSWL